MKTPKPPVLPSHDGELLRALFFVPNHRQWCVEVTVMTLAFLHQHAPWAARFISPSVIRVFGAVLADVADIVFFVKYGTRAV